MQSDELLKRAKDGDRQAFIEWFQPYQDMFSKFAYQAGVPKDEVGIFKLEVMKEISNALETIDGQNAENRIMQSAVRVLKKKQEEPANRADDSIKFAEDLETHKAIQKLPFSDRLVFLLLYFHRKDSGEAGAILDQPAAAVEVSADRASVEIRRQLASGSEADMQKRLDLLAKSYNRIQFPEEKDHLIEEIIAADEPKDETAPTEKTPVNRKTFAILAGASLFLSAVIGASFLFNEQPGNTSQNATEEENPTSVSNEMVDNWEAEYDEIRASAPERLGLPVETFEQLEFVRKADALKERTFSRQNVKQLRGDPERMQEQVDKLMLSIDTPKGMLDSVEDYTMLVEETSEFLWIYTEKTDQLMTIANGLLEKHMNELSIAKVNGELSAEKLTYSRSDYPEEIEKLTKALSEYTFNYTVHPNEDRFRTVRDVNKFFEIHPFNSDPHSTYYLEILRNAPFTDDTGLLWPVSDLPHSLWPMVEFLGEPTVDPGLKEKVELLLIQTFHSMVKGDGYTEVFDSNGVVKEEFQIAWEGMLQLNSNPITFLMLPIVEEFEASGWKESVHYDQLSYQELLYAIEMERNGELAEKLPNGDLKLESARVDMQGYEYTDIKPLYKEFSASYDMSLLSGIDPMEIIKLYYYANKIEDIKTMWHLTADSMLKPSLEDYTKQWKKRPEITETLRNIEIYEGNFHRQGREILLVAMATPLEDDFHNYNMPEMILITERDEIWLMQHQINEFYARDDNFIEYDANVQSYYKKLVQSEELEMVQHASPAEIGGIFLLALENEDYETLRLLINMADNSIDDEEFKLRWNSMQMPAYSKFGGISFRADIYNLGMEDQKIRGSIDIMNDATMMESHYLPMVKVGENWMIEDMFDI